MARSPDVPMIRSSAPSSPYLLLANIGQLLTLRGAAGPRRGFELGEVGLIEDAAVLCGGGQIIAAGKQREVLGHLWLRKNKRRLREIDCNGGEVLAPVICFHPPPLFTPPPLGGFV